MADNFTFLDATSVSRTVRATEISTGIWVPWNYVQGTHLEGDAVAGSKLLVLGATRRSNAVSLPGVDGTIAGLITDDSGRLRTNLEGTTVVVQPSSSYPVQAAQRTDVAYNGTTAVTPKFAIVNVAGDSTDAEIVAAVTSKKIRVVNYTLVVGDVRTTLTWGSRISGTTTAKSGPMRFGDNGGLAPGEAILGHFETAAGAALVMTTAGTGSATTGHLTYLEI